MVYYYSNIILEVLIILEFKEVTLAQKPLFEAYISASHQRGSECAFSNLFIWRDCYHIYWCQAYDFLLLKVKRNNVDFYIQPFGGRDEDLPKLMKDLVAEHGGQPFAMHGIYDFTKERFEKMLPGLTYEDDRDNWDYVYLREKLATLSGRKLHGQKNHYNAFAKAHPGYTYEPITIDNMAECMDFAEEWCNQRMAEDPSVAEEKRAIQQAFLSFEALGLRGGALRHEGRLLAISYGKKINEDTAVIHVEKALPGVRGLYTAMTKEFAAHAWQDVTYLNREEDMGHEGLRTAKEALHPEFMIKKYNVIIG